MTLYVDGSPSTTGNTSAGSVASFSSTGTNIKIGNNDANEYFAGSIDDVLIYNRTLSSGDVAALYSAGAA